MVSTVFLSAAIGLMALAWEGVPFYRGYQILGWPTAQGWIEQSSLKHSLRTYYPLVLYTFMVKGKAYSGNTVYFGYGGDGDVRQAQNILDRYPANKVVSVYYLPSDPGVSVLEPGLHGGVGWQLRLALFSFL